MQTLRSQYSREEDNMPIWARVLYKYGVPSGIALFLVWFIASQLNANVKSMREETSQELNSIKREVHDHVFQTGFYMHSICINMAIGAGMDPVTCEPPR